jgi:hypothetical protein
MNLSTFATPEVNQTPSPAVTCPAFQAFLEIVRRTPPKPSYWQCYNYYKPRCDDIHRHHHDSAGSPGEMEDGNLLII